jgi:hypothetical protein
MLGLGLGKFGKGVKSGIAKLLSSLKRRAEYFENKKDSKSQIKVLKDYELLDKASILLTPTATSDARVHCVKPSLPDYGKTLIPNSGNADSWTINNSSGTIVNENGYLKLTDTSGAYAYAYIPITVETGKDYIITYNLVGSGTSSSNYVRIGNSINTTSYYNEDNFTDTGKRTIRISPSETTIYITLISGMGIGKYAYWNDITVQATADFDFDRASSATRINSDGLVQDMQSITDPELVLNGDFEELGDNLVANGTFDLGDEEVTNGDFSNGSANWSTPTGWEIIDGKLKGTNVNAVSATQGSHTFLNKSFKVVYTVSDYARGDVRIYLGGTQQTPNRSANGTYTEYITITTANTTLYIQGINNFTGSIESISVKEVPHWSLQEGWSIENGFAVQDGTNASYSSIQQNSVTTSTKTYKVSIDIDEVSGPVELKGAGVYTRLDTLGVGSHVIYITADASYIRVLAFPGSKIKFKDFFAQQVNVDSDGNDIWSVTNSDAYNYVEFTEGFARLKFLNTTPITMLNSTLTLEQDKTYELVVDVYDVTSGSIKIDAAGLSELFNEEGVTTRYLKPTGNTTLSFYRATADVDITLASVSVKEVTFSDDVDLARINYDSNGENGHILLEPTSTNLIPYSEDFTDSSWDLDFSAPYITRTPNAATSPSGKNNATKLIGNNTSRDPNNSYVGVFTSASAPYTSSIFAKKGEYDYLVLGIGSYGGGYYAIFNLSNGTVSTSPTASGTTASIEDYGNGWHRCAITTTNTSGGELLFISPSVDGTLTTDYTSTTNGVYVWGAQLEALSYATSYIPTLTGSTVTRATETLTGSGNSTLINSTEGVLYAEIADITNDNLSDNNIISISKSTDEDFRVHIALKTNGTIQGFIREGAANTKLDVSSTTVLPSTSFFKVAVLFESGNNKLYVNGLQIGSTDTSTFSNLQLNSLQFNRGDDDKIFYGKCKALAVFNEALSDDELELLTGVTNYGSFGELASANGYTII